MEQCQPVLFQSDFVHDLKLQKEFSKSTHHGNRVVQLCAIILIGVLLWFFYAMFFRLNAPEEFSTAMLGMTLLYLIIEGIRVFTRRGGGIHYKRSLLTNGGKPVRCSIRFCEDAVITVNLDSDSSSSLAYDQLTTLLETKNLLLLGMKLRLYLIVDKRTLTGGRTALLEFLHEKCPRLRKVRSLTPGLWLARLKYAFIAILLLIALVYHPALQLRQRMSGQIHNGMSCSEIAGELERFGITGMDQDTLRAYDSIYASPLFLTDSKLDILLRDMGMGTYHPKTDSWIPSESGVLYLFDYGMDEDSMYKDLLRGIGALSKRQLEITRIREHWESQTVTTEFLLNGKECSITAEVLDGRYDPYAFLQINAYLNGTGKQLYFADCGGYSFYVFYGDSGWAEDFAGRTGLFLSSDFLDIR